MRSGGARFIQDLVAALPGSIAQIHIFPVVWRHQFLEPTNVLKFGAVEHGGAAAGECRIKEPIARGLGGAIVACVNAYESTGEASEFSSSGHASGIHVDNAAVDGKYGRVGEMAGKAADGGGTYLNVVVEKEDERVSSLADTSVARDAKSGIGLVGNEIEFERRAGRRWM